MTSTSVVIPVFNNWEGCHNLLFDLYKNCSLIEEIIIVNDASPDTDVMSGLNWWKSTNMLPIEIIDLKNNLGFLRASNLGIKEAVEDVVCLISTDVRVYGDIIESSKDLHPEYIKGGKYLDWDTGWNKFGNKIFPYLEGWLLTAHKETWEDLGYFDERFVPHDYEDISFSTKAISMGLGLMEYPDGLVEHLGGKSIGYNEEREKITKEHKKIFEEIWVK